MNIRETRKILVFSASAALIMLIMKDDEISSYIFFSILIISAAYSVFSAKGFNKRFTAIMTDTACTLMFSLSVAVCFYIVWSYLILPDRFMNIFILQYSALFPSLIVLFASICIINPSLNEKKLNHKKILKTSVMAAVSISIIISIAYLASVNYIYKQKVHRFEKIYDVFLNDVSELTKYYDNDLKVFKEIKTYQEGIVEEAGYMKSKFLEDYSKRGVCIKSNCIESIGEIEYYSMKLAIEPETIKDTLKKADEIKNNLEDGNGKERHTYKNGEGGFKEYLELLGRKINSSDMDSHSLEIDYNEVEILVETDFNYVKFLNIVKKRKTLQEAIDPEIFYEDVFDRDSLFYSSVYNTFFHTKEFKELVRLLAKFSTYTSKNEVFLNIYSNRYVDESDESKMIRFWTIRSIMESRIY